VRSADKEIFERSAPLLPKAGALGADGIRTSYYGVNLTAYVENRTIPESRIDDMATEVGSAQAQA
jgi:hypothetical protein